jgi:serine/threonine protein kinase
MDEFEHEFDQSKGILLGEGAFGQVYKAQSKLN